MGGDEANSVLFSHGAFLVSPPHALQIGRLVLVIGISEFRRLNTV